MSKADYSEAKTKQRRWILRRLATSLAVYRFSLERRVRLGTVSLMLALLLSAALLPTSAPASAAGTISMRPMVDTPADLNPNILGDSLPTPAGSFIDRLGSSQTVKFEVGLQMPDEAAAEQYVASLHDPSSPNYDHYLTPAEYNARFNPSQQQQDYVVNYLTTHGFSITSTASNHLVLGVSGPTSLIEKTFHTRLSSYHYTNDSTGASFDYVAPENQVILPSSLQGLVSGVNLNSFPLQPMNTGLPKTIRNSSGQVLAQLKANPNSGNKSVSTITNQTSDSGLGPSDLRNLYDITPLTNAGTNGSGQTIGLFELGDFDPNNINAYKSYFGLPSPNISIVQIGDRALITTGTDAEGEAELDIEVVMAIAPKANIIVYEGPVGDAVNQNNAFDIAAVEVFNAIVIDNKASIVSISYGNCESGGVDHIGLDALRIIDAIFLQGRAQGITFFASSGDSGAYQCTQSSYSESSDLLGVNYPASDPNVIAVGGTQFISNVEYPWFTPPANDGSSHTVYGDGTGGGLSSVFQRPSWQASPGVLNQYSNGMREVPDVSALAGLPDYSVFVFIDKNHGSGFIPIGGTSAATPLWAAATSLINQRAGKKVLSVDRLYSIASTKNNVFRDITEGPVRLSPYTPGYYPATSGYDMATGLGTADFAQLSLVLNGQPAVTNPTAAPTNAPQPTATSAPQPTPTPQPTATSAPQPTSTPAPPQPTPTPPPSGPANNAFYWKKYSVTPVLPPGAAGKWDSSAVYPQTIVWDSSAKVYRMWYIGSGVGLPALGYASSPDGINWTRNPNPVISAGPSGNWDSQGIYQAAVIYDPDQKVYKAWYSSKTPYTGLNIGYAVSYDGVSWNKDASPVLLAGPTAYDFGGLQPSTVIKEAGQYELWYEAINNQNQRSLAYAVSLDGIHWAKASKSNITINGAVYNADGPGAPMVVHVGSYYLLWYHTSTNIMQASSTDGVNYTLDPSSGPVLDVSPAGAGDSSRLIIPRVVIRSDINQALMWYTGYNGAVWSGMLATSGLNAGPPPTVSPTPQPTPSVPVPTPPPPNPNGVYADPAFQQVWNRTDSLVLNGAAQGRSWIWGPGPQASAYEPYTDSPNGLRLVQYFDKGRMEINNPSADRNGQYFVSSGLLAKELVSGSIQTGNNSYQNIGPAQVPIAGDSDDTNGPTYAAMSNLLNAPSVQLYQPETLTIDHVGNTGDNPALAGYGVTAAYYIPETKHSIASPFWGFLNSTGLVQDSAGNRVVAPLFSPTFYVTGLPITEAYWAKVKVGGQVKDVLIQVFERRVLTYTPSNSAAFQVEMGNVGRAYFQWRYNEPLS